MNKPRIYRRTWHSIPDNIPEHRWHVAFRDTCGCAEEEDFPTWTRALAFASRIADGIDRWHA